MSVPVIGQSGTINFAALKILRPCYVTGRFHALN